MYGLHLTVSENTACLGISVADFLCDQARAQEERADLEWEGVKMTNMGIGMWAANYGDRVARLRHLTDAHLAQAMAEQEAPRPASTAYKGRHTANDHIDIFFSEAILNFLFFGIDSEFLIMH